MEQETTQGWISVDDIRLAACFLTFGATWRRDTPVWRSREFDFHELIQAGREGREPRSTELVIYYIDGLEIGQARAITKAFMGKSASEDFHAFVDGLALSDEDRIKLYALHSNALAQSCREVSEQREFLEYLDRDQSKGGHRPDDAKWIKISKGAHFIVLGENASPETRRKFLKMLNER
jgi:hypothetical protein